MTRIGATPSQQEYTPTEVVGTALGWYFYGITECESLTPALLAACGESGSSGSIAPLGDEEPLQFVELAELAAVVRQVRLEDFQPAALKERLHNDNELEALVRWHNNVVEAIHAQQAILPSKFGVVYAHADDIQSALRPAHDTLLRRLRRLHGCDEWAIHVYADETLVRERLAEVEPAIRTLRRQLAVARPGRAYFLEQQLRGELDAASEQALLTHAERIFDRLSVLSLDAQASPAKTAADGSHRVEVLRASFLISREVTEQFKAEAQLCCDESEGLRCEYTGPWPPYSFAAQDDEETV